MKVLQDRSLAPFHTFGLDVKAKQIVMVETEAELVSVWQDVCYRDWPKLIIGQGSNLLFCEDFGGLVIVNRICGVDVTETNDAYCLHVGAGEDWHQLVEMTVNAGMPGLENMALIPGCVGSSPIQNIGAYGVELKDRCQYVDTIELATGKSQRLFADECQFGYRDSVFKHELQHTHAITAVGLRLSKNWVPNISYGPLAQFNPETVAAADIMEKVCTVRMEKLPDPSQTGNAGSFFKNPVVSATLAANLVARFPAMPAYPAGDGLTKLAAGWLIDQCGLKGHQIGGARVHDNQALVLVNYQEASPKDLLALARYVVESVEARFGVKLEHEVRFMGSRSETNLAEVLDERA